MNTEPTDRRTTNTFEQATTSHMDEVISIGHQLGDALDRGKVKLSELQTALTEKTRECVHRTDAFVRANPWQAVGWAAGIGFMIGLLTRRR